jgi:hypothetical protein
MFFSAESDYRTFLTLMATQQVVDMQTSFTLTTIVSSEVEIDTTITINSIEINTFIQLKGASPSEIWLFKNKMKIEFLS